MAAASLQFMPHCMMMLSRDLRCTGRPDVFTPTRSGIRFDRGHSLKVFFAAMLCCVCIHAKAALSSVTVSVPQQEDFSDVPITFQKFDPSQGKLASVEIILQGTGEMTQEYENTSHSSSSARFRQKLLLTLTTPNANSPLLSASQIERHSYSADSFDGVVDFGGTSGDTGIYDVTALNQTVLQSKKNLAMFTGSDSMEMFLSSDSSFHIASRKNGRFGVDSLAGAEITVIYNYTSVPEPVWFGGLAGAFALVCAFRFQARNRSA